MPSFSSGERSSKGIPAFIFSPAVLASPKNTLPRKPGTFEARVSDGIKPDLGLVTISGIGPPAALASSSNTGINSGLLLVPMFSIFGLCS